MKLIKFAFSIAAALAASVAIQASPITTANLSLSVADVTFGNFGCSVARGGVFAGPGTCSAINVNTSAGSNLGLTFISGFSAAGSNAYDHVRLTYDVSSQSGIDGFGLDFNGSFVGEAASSVRETIYHEGTLIRSAFLTCGPHGCVRSDSVDFGAVYSDLHIQDELYVCVLNGVAQVSTLNQEFALAPEPAATALIGFGLIAVAGLLKGGSILKIRQRKK